MIAPLLLALAVSPSPQAAEVLELDASSPVFPETQERTATYYSAGRIGGEVVLGARLYRVLGGFEQLERNALVVTDGTATGTRVVAELDRPGSSYELPSIESAALPNGDLVLSLVSEPVGAELFVLRAGTLRAELLADVWPGPGDSRPRAFCSWMGEVWLRAEAPDGIQIWRTDGTPGGTVRSRVPLGTLGPATELTPAGANLFVSGNAAGLLARQDPASPWTLIQPPTGGAFGEFFGTLGAVGDDLLCVASTPSTGTEPWACDGTPSGLQPLGDLEPGPLGSILEPLAVNGSQVLFGARTVASGEEPWVSDGTPAGTFLLRDLQGGVGSGLANFPGPFAAGTPGGFYFSGNNGVNGAEIWFSDGTTAGTAMIVDHLPGSFGSDPLDFLFEGGALYFTAQEDPSNFERRLYRHTPGDTAFVTLGDSGLARPLGVAGGRLIVTAPTNGFGSLLVNDGTPDKLDPLVDLTPQPTSGSSYPRGIDRVDFRGIVIAEQASAGLEPYVFDPATLGLTDELHKGPGSSGSAPQLLGETAQGPLFAQSNFFGLELHLGDGLSGPPPLFEFAPGPASASFSAGVELAGRVLFHIEQPSSARGLWSSDGTAAGTQRLATTTAGAAIPLDAGSVARLNGRLWFALEGDLWSSDGESAAPSGLAPAVGLPIGAGVARVGDVIVFEAAGLTASSSASVWITNGTAAGTVLVRDLIAPTADAKFIGPIAVGPRAVFAFESLVSGQEVWGTDGTSAGTQLLVDATPGTDGAVLDLLCAGDRAFWLTRALDGTGAALWSSDGTPSGTTLVTRGDSAVGGLVAERLWSVGSRHVGLRGLDAAHGHELWISDGTPAGTGVLDDAVDGPAGCFPTEAARVGDSLLFAARDPLLGVELFRLPFAAVGGPAADEVGVDCGARLALATGAADLGAAVQFEVSDLQPGVPTALLYSGSLVVAPLVDACVQYIGVPRLLALQPSSAAGRTLLDVTIPADPMLAGRRLALQALAVEVPGPLFGFFETTQALDVVLGN